MTAIAVFKVPSIIVILSQSVEAKLDASDFISQDKVTTLLRI